MKDINLLITCKDSYLEFLPYCIESIYRNIGNNFISKFLFVDNKFKVKLPEFKVITDQQAWKIIDPKWQHEELFEEKWIMQQIIKLNCDKFMSGQVLIVDADLVFLKPISILEEKLLLYTSIEYDKEYYNMIKSLTGINQMTKLNQSFITDFALFNTNVLKMLHADIENFTKQPWKEAIQTRLLIPGYNLSEYELYGNYLLARYPHLVKKIITPSNYLMRTLVKWKNSSYEELINDLRLLTDNSYQCIDIVGEREYQ